MKIWTNDSSRRDLQDLHAFAPPKPQYFRTFSSNIFALFGKIRKLLTLPMILEKIH